MPPKQLLKNKKQPAHERGVPRPLVAQQVLSLVRTAEAGIASNGPGFNNADNFYFGLSLAPGMSELTSLFLEIRLDRIVIKWVPAFNVARAVTPLDNTVMYYAFNPANSSTGIPTNASIRENGSVHEANVMSGFTFAFVPRYLTRLGDQLSTYYGYEPTNRHWLRKDSTDLRCYGFDWFLSETGLPINEPLGRFIIEYHITCRHTI